MEGLVQGQGVEEQPIVEAAGHQVFLLFWGEPKRKTEALLGAVEGPTLGKTPPLV